ncbi:hypothetical protein [Acinetobacter indicus]|uniref:hypothetical protein n=1 Tax=Acinetobacter indicus TaxID=756892 RepID=UPI00257710B2|nr:hypothetical protein [Acinetobacter indicus]MDM1328917.1 hypothetical protein [Acinetobacter indicus]
MLNKESSILIARSIINLIDEIQLKLKKLNVNRDGINYLVLTELYSLRTRVYIVMHESHFFELDQEISDTEINNTFQSIKDIVNKNEDLIVLKKIVFLISMLISSIGVGESENVSKILNKIREVS